MLMKAIGITNLTKMKVGTHFPYVNLIASCFFPKYLVEECGLVEKERRIMTKKNI